MTFLDKTYTASGNAEYMMLLVFVFVSLVNAAFFWVISAPFLLVIKRIASVRWPTAPVQAPASRYAPWLYLLYILALAAVGAFYVLGLAWAFMYWVTDGGNSMP